MIGQRAVIQMQTSMTDIANDCLVMSLPEPGRVMERANAIFDSVFKAVRIVLLRMTTYTGEQIVPEGDFFGFYSLDRLPLEVTITVTDSTQLKPGCTWQDVGKEIHDAIRRLIDEIGTAGMRDWRIGVTVIPAIKGVYVETTE